VPYSILKVCECDNQRKKLGIGIYEFFLGIFTSSLKNYKKNRMKEYSGDESYWCFNYVLFS
jgi:hypothetical protein